MPAGLYDELGLKSVDGDRVGELGGAEVKTSEKTLAPGCKAAGSVNAYKAIEGRAHYFCFGQGVGFKVGGLPVGAQHGRGGGEG